MFYKAFCKNKKCCYPNLCYCHEKLCKKVKFVKQNFGKVKDFFSLFVVKCQRNEFGRDLSNFCKF